MARRLRSFLGSGFGLAIYVVCTALVFSFIVFEVLDVDGSDFPAKPSTAATPANLAEPRHDTRRAFLKGPALAWMDPWALFASRSGESVRLQRTAAVKPSPVVSPRAHGSRAALPRSSLAGSPPSA